MNIFLLTIVFGIIAGIVWELGYIIRAITDFSIISTIIVDFIATCIAGYLFWHCILTYNNGIIRLYEVLGFFIGFEVVLLSIGNLVANSVNIIYNYIQKVSFRLEEKRRKK